VRARSHFGIPRFLLKLINLFLYCFIVFYFVSVALFFYPFRFSFLFFSYVPTCTSTLLESFPKLAPVIVMIPPSCDAFVEFVTVGAEGVC
jgi:hypothetical protein